MAASDLWLSAMGIGCDDKKFQEDVFPKEYAKELLRIAEDDLESAVAFFSAKAGRPENIVFIAQQSVEKAIKAVLVHLQLAFR